MIPIPLAMDTVFKPLFKDPETWKAWRVFLKTLFALPLDNNDLALYRACTGRQTPPDKPFSEAWVPCGVRSGKSFIAALVAVYLACFFDYRQYTSPGEIPRILILAADRAQAQVIFRYIKSFLSEIPILAPLVKAERAESLDLEVPFDDGFSLVMIQVSTVNYRSVRGFTAAAVICDEIAFWRDDSGANPATEVIRALRPRLATIPSSIFLAISSPYSRTGPLFQAFQDHYGVDGSPVLCWKAPTRTMNPTIPQELIDRDMASDPEAAMSEWGADFRTDLETFLPLDKIVEATVSGRRELPPMSGVYYKAFFDPSGGRGDAAALAIAHIEGGRVILDLVRRYPAPHDPSVVISKMAEVLKEYRITRVTGDRYAGAFPEKEFLKHHIVYEAAQKNKSSLYLEVLPMFLSGRVEILDNKTLFNELKSLERRTRSSGRDQVDHPPKGHDDLANAVAGVCVLTAEQPAGGISYISVEQRRFGNFDEDADRRGDREDIPFIRSRERKTGW
jgi:hypothetical protein